MRYDLIVIGSGPAAREGAIAAARRYKRVALVSRPMQTADGVYCDTGVISVADIREEILRLSGCTQPGAYGDRYRRRHAVTMDDVRRTVARREAERARELLERHAIDTFVSEARFVGPHEVEIETAGGTTRLAGDKFLLACGTRPARPAHLPFDGETLFDSDDVWQVKQTPRSLVIIGGGSIGIEHGIMFAALGADVTIVEGRDRLVDSCNYEFLQETLPYARSLGIVFRLGEEVIGIDRLRDGSVSAQLDGGKRIAGEAVLCAAGRVGDTREMQLAAAGIETDERGRLWCNEDQQTWVEHVYGAGDVVGFPAPAGDSIEQSRRAVRHAFDGTGNGNTADERTTVAKTDQRRSVTGSRVESAMLAVS